MQLKINIERLKRNIEELGGIGRDPRGGVSRPSFSNADLEARAWLKKKIEAAGLAYRVDGAGNIFGRLGGDGPLVMAGSHIDTVLNGGRFDGAAGVLAALEAVQRICEEGYRLAKPLAVAAFTDDLAGAVWIPGDGKANPTDLTQSLAKGARMGDRLRHAAGRGSEKYRLHDRRHPLRAGRRSSTRGFSGVAHRTGADARR